MKSSLTNPSVWLGALVVFVSCGIGMLRESSSLFSLSRIYDEEELFQNLRDSLVCFRCPQIRECVPADSSARISRVLKTCGAFEHVLPRLRSRESIQVVVSDNGGFSLAPLPLHLKVAFGLPLCLSEIDAQGWRLAPGVGRVLSERLATWNQSREGKGCAEAACRLHSVSGIGTIRAARIRAFFGLYSRCNQLR